MERTKGITHSGTKASKTTGVVANDNAILVEALEHGIEGNDITIAYVDPAGNNVPLSVAESGGDIVVTLETNGTSVAISTADEVIDAINDDVDANELVLATNAPGSNGSGVAIAAAEAPLTGGTASKVESVTLDEVVTDPEGELAVQIPEEPEGEEYVDATLRDELSVHERPTPMDVFAN